MLRKFFVAVALGVVALLASCALLDWYPAKVDENDPRYRSVETMLSRPDFRSDNLPIRTLRVAVIANEWVGRDFTVATFRDASELLYSQVGIRLEVVLFTDEPKFGTRSFLPIHHVLRVFRRTHRDFDFIVGVSLTYDNNERPCFFGTCYVGMVDDGRNIALLTLSRTVIVHEIGHLFLGIGHSPAGIMRPMSEGDYFSVKDREIILENKWKEFRDGPMDEFLKDAYY